MDRSLTVLDLQKTVQIFSMTAIMFSALLIFVSGKYLREQREAKRLAVATESAPKYVPATDIRLLVSNEVRKIQ